MTKINVDNLKGGFEPEVYRGLQALKRKHRFTFEYEPEAYNYYVEHWYTPDWKIERKDGSHFFVESKGWWKSQERTKLLKTLKEHPELDIRMLFQYDNKLNKGSKSRYSDWCKKHGIKYSVGSIPEDWF